MAGKDDFTPEEWQILEFAMTDTMAYMSMVDPGFWASFKEAGAVANFLAQQRNNSPSDMVRALVDGVHAKRDSELSANPANIESPTLDRIEAAVALVAEKTPDELQAFKNLINGVARSAANAAGGVSAAETAAMDKISAALGD